MGSDRAIAESSKESRKAIALPIFRGNTRVNASKLVLTKALTMSVNQTIRIERLIYVPRLKAIAFSLIDKRTLMR